MIKKIINPNIFWKKAFFFVTFFIFCATFSFCQFMWSTVPGNQPHTSTRIISMNSVKSEVLRLFDQNSFLFFDWGSTNHFLSRDDYLADRRRSLNSATNANNSTQRHHDEWVIYWMNNNRRFVYAYSSEAPSFTGGKMTWAWVYRVNFIIGDDVVSMSFSNADTNNNNCFPTNSENRRILTGIIDDILN